jgi:ABC-type transport system substrate-binding protein
MPLVFETLTMVDGELRLQPGLAASWESSGGRWRFRIRGGVVLHDGSVLQAWQAAASLRTANPSWAVDADGDFVIVDRAPIDLPWELARGRNAVAVRTPAGTLVGTGAFRVDRLDGRRIMLRAHDSYWNARPFLDAVQIEMGRPAADQLSSIERGAADFVSTRPLDVRRLAQRSVRTVSSRPLELVALVFEPHRATAPAADVRAALANAVDRTTLATVLLQRRAEPANALLPPWLSGYSLPRSGVGAPLRAAIASMPAAERSITIRVEAGDAVSQAIAERLVVDARESGLAVSVQAPSGLAPRPDVRVVRVPLDASTPDRVLGGAIAALGGRVITLAANDVSLPPGSGVDAVQRAERALLEHQIIVPLVYLPDLYAFGDRVHSWNGQAVLPTGALNLANVWIE